MPDEKAESKLFAATSSSYAAYLLRSTIHANGRLVEQVESLKPITPTSYILDNGCGTGALAISLQGTHPSTPMLATDISPEMLQILDQRVTAEKWTHIRTQVADAHSLSGRVFPSNNHAVPGEGLFSHVFTTFMLQFVADPNQCLQEMYAVTQQDGVMGATIWTYLAMRDVISRLHERCLPGVPIASPFKNVSAWTNARELAEAVKTVGFRDVCAVELDVPFFFETADEFCNVFFEAKNPTSEALIANWPSDSIDRLKGEMLKLITEEFDDGKGIQAKAAFVVGRR